MGNKAILFTFLVFTGIFYTFKKPYIGVLLYVGITYIRPSNITYGQTRFLEFYLLTFGVVIFSWFINKSKLPVFENQSNVLLFLWGFTLMQMVSSFGAVADPSISFHFTFEMFKIVLFCFFILKLIDTEKKFFHFLLANLTGTAFIALWAFDQHFRGNARLEEVAGGNYNDSNGLAALMVQFSPIFFSFLFFGSKKLKIVGVIIATAMVADIIFSQSRAALLGVGVGFAFMLLRANMKIRIVSVIIGLAVSPLIKEAMMDTEGYVDRIQIENMQESKGADRFAIWTGGLRMFQDNMWIGVGQQNFKYLSRDYAIQEDSTIKFKVGDAHNTLILIACEGGVFALIFYLLALFCFFVNSHQLKKELSEKQKHFVILLTALEAGTIGFHVAGMFHSYVYMENYYWILISPAILKNVLALQKQKKVEEI